MDASSYFPDEPEDSCGGGGGNLERSRSLEMNTERTWDNPVINSHEDAADVEIFSQSGDWGSLPLSTASMSNDFATLPLQQNDLASYISASKSTRDLIMNNPDRCNASDVRDPTVRSIDRGENSLSYVGPFDDDGSYYSGGFSDQGNHFHRRDSSWNPATAGRTTSSARHMSANYGNTDDSTFEDALIGLESSYLASNFSSSSVDSIASSASAYARKRRRQGHSSRKPFSMQRIEIRRYQCTFCTDSFRTKYDWQRHENTIHLNLEQWECTRFGPVMNGPDGAEFCVFCKQTELTADHSDIHNCSACLAKPRQERFFRRKDHLRQHLRLFHNECVFHSHMESWLFAIENVQSRCGFCDATMTTWAERQKHLARHFKNGADMRDWKGDRGFDQQIDSLVENDIPAFLISDQRNTVEPFSASQADHLVRRAEMAPRYESTPFIPSSQHNVPSSAISDTAHLSGEGALQSPHSHRHVESLLLNYVSEEIKDGRVPSDGKLQKKMSEIMYGSDSEWDQTWADNPQWLQQFRKKAGLISLPLTGGKNAFVGKDAD